MNTGGREMKSGIGILYTILALSLLFNVCLSGYTPARAEETTIFSEDFEGLPLGPSVEERNTTGKQNVWTHTPPSGWSVDRSGVPGVYADSANNGVIEWFGWCFADRDFWMQSDFQNREQFTNAGGILAVADSDEWDDQGHPGGSYNTYLRSPHIVISGVKQNTMSLSFDSSWRPEGNQTANVTVSFDGGSAVELFRWTSKPDATNETFTVSINNPASANTMVVTFGYFNASNNWWWAIDNIKIVGDANPIQDRIEFLHTSGATIVFEKGETTDTFDVKLLQQPTADVLVTIDPTDVSIPVDPNDNTFGNDLQLIGGGVSGSGGKRILTFTPSNWNIPQTVMVKAVDDAVKEGPETVLMITDVNSVDPAYAGGYVRTPLRVVVIDDDAANIVIFETEDNTVVREGAALPDTFSVALSALPTDSVEIHIDDTSDPIQVVVEPGILTFTPDNWDLPQTVAVSAVDDTQLEKDPHLTTLRYSLVSQDLAYNGLEVQGLSVQIQENECGAWGMNVFDVIGPDGKPDCVVNLLDLAEFCLNWLVCTKPYENGCISLP